MNARMVASDTVGLDSAQEGYENRGILSREYTYCAHKKKPFEVFEKKDKKRRMYSVEERVRDRMLTTTGRTNKTISSRHE